MTAIQKAAHYAGEIERTLALIDFELGITPSNIATFPDGSTVELLDLPNKGFVEDQLLRITLRRPGSEPIFETFKRVDPAPVTPESHQNAPTALQERLNAIP